MLKLLAFVLPLGLDSFAVAAAIGAAQATTAWQRLRISLVFTVFEGGMPLIGLGLGSALAHGAGQVADYIAGRRAIGIGAWMLLSSDQDEEDKAARITTSVGPALIGLGISISLDELGLATGARIAERVRVSASAPGIPHDPNRSSPPVLGQG
jgi:putative Mn2+ efflux pump MntP